MPKTKTKVEENEVEIVVEKPTKKKKPTYSIVIKLNDQVHEIETDNIEEAIKSVEPEFIKTKFVFQITKDGKTLDRLIYANEAKKLFWNKIYLEAFIRNLIF